MDILYDLGIVNRALQHIDKNSDVPNKKEWLRLLSCMSAFGMYNNQYIVAFINNVIASFREYPECGLILNRCIELLTSEDVSISELAIWVVANISGDPKTHVDIGKRAILTLIDFISKPKTQTILQHTLRCVTNLFVNSANRKVFDAWGSVGDLIRAIGSESLEVQTHAVWCLSHLVSPETAHLFESQDELIKQVLLFTCLGSVTLETSSWRLLSNLSLLERPRAIMIENNVFESLQDAIVSHVEDLKENEEKDESSLQEALGCFSTMITKEKSLLTSVSTEVIHNLLTLLGARNPDTRLSSAWALAYLSEYERNQTKVVASNGIDAVIDRIEEGGDERIPCIWVLANLSTNNEYCERIRESDGIHVLVKLLFRANDDERLVVGKALSHLSTNSKNKILLRNLFSKLSQKSDANE